MKSYILKHLPFASGHCLLLASLFIVALVQALANAQSLNEPIGIDNFGKVSDRYYRGSQPEAEHLVKLKALGVKTVIDMRKDRVNEASAWARDAGLQYINIPLTTKRAATEEQTAYFLSLVNDPANWPVYVHCKGGRHRTGEMTAIYRITQDRWTAEQAYTEMKKYDFEDSFFYPRILKKYVFSFYERFNSEKTSKAKSGNAGAPATDN
jgi:protein tyrosine/serine phosphatase